MTKHVYIILRRQGKLQVPAMLALTSAGLCPHRPESLWMLNFGKHAYNRVTVHLAGEKLFYKLLV